MRRLGSGQLKKPTGETYSKKALQATEPGLLGHGMYWQLSYDVDHPTLQLAAPQIILPS